MNCDLCGIDQIIVLKENNKFLSLWNVDLCGISGHLIVVFVEFLVIYFKGIRQLNVFWFYIVTGLGVGKGVA